MVVLHQPCAEFSSYGSSQERIHWHSALVSSADLTENLVRVHRDSTADSKTLHPYFWSLLSLLSATSGFPLPPAPVQPPPTEDILQLLVLVLKLSPYCFHNITPVLQRHCRAHF